MKHADYDNLYDFFERHLFEAEFDENEDHQSFIRRVAYDYCSDLSEKGIILGNHLQQIRIDVEEEVAEMLQKKIYGHFNLKQFRICINKKENA